MRERMQRLSFIAAIVGSSTILVALLVASLIHVAHAQTRPGGRGGGGAGGVSLQQSFPGTRQTGNIHITGALGLNVTGTTQFSSGAYMQAPSGGLQFFPADYNTNMPGSRDLQYGFYGPQNNAPLLDFKWIRGATGSQLQMQHTGCDINNACLSTDGGNAISPLYLAGSGSVGKNRVVTTTQGLNVTTGNLFEVTNNGVTEASVAFNGALTTAVPIPQASGGTGTGALTCAAGSFLTSNGAAYSCAATSAQYFTFNSGVQSLAAVAGSSCNTLAITTTLVSTAGFGCVATASPAFGTVPLTLTCEMTGGTQANVRICNTGVNSVTPPVSTTYFVRIFP